MIWMVLLLAWFVFTFMLGWWMGAKRRGTDMGTIAWFGRCLDAPAYDHAPQVPVPFGAECLGCGELIDENDSGITMPYMTNFSEVTRAAFHTECHLRSVIGGVAHLEKRCYCYGGGTSDDDRSRTEARWVLEWAMERGARWR